MKKIMTTSELIDALGGNSRVCQLCNSKPSAVSNWRQMDRLPWKMHAIVKAEAKRKKLDVSPTIYGVAA